MSEEERKDLLDEEENDIKGDLADFSGGEEEDGQLASSNSHLVLDSAITTATSAPAPSDNEDASSMPTPTIKRKADALSSDSQKKSKKLKRAAVLGIDDEAERSDDGEESGAAAGEDGDDDDEDEEDEEGLDDYEYDDFVVKEASDVDSDDENPKQKKKTKKTKLSKLKKRKDNMQLEEEDLALVRENMEQSPPRQQQLPTIDNFKMDGDEDDYGDYGGTGNRFNGYDDEDDMDDFIESSHGGGRLRPKQRDIPGRRHHALDESTFDQLREADEIFGAGYDDFLDEDEDEEDLDEEKAAAAKERELERKKMLATSKGFYEYSQLVENFLLEEDEVIRSTDIPERFQLALKGREVPSEMERLEEARWISTLVAQKILASYRAKDIVDKDNLVYDIVDSVEVVLKFIQVERLEVPFIWLYRRDYLHPSIERDDLWTIVGLDERWEAIYALRHKMHANASKLYFMSDNDQEQEEETLNEEEEGAAESQDQKKRLKRMKACLREAARLFPKDRFTYLVENCYEEEKLRNIFNFVRLLGTDYDTVKSEYNKYKRLRCVREMAEAIALPAHVIGSFLSGAPKQEPPHFGDLKVEEVVRNIAQRNGYKGGNLVAAAEIVLATELSHEPVLRDMAKSIFISQGSLSTLPTPKGKSGITPFSEYFGLHYLKGKPLSELTTPEGLLFFMRVLQIEQMGLITIQIEPPMTDGPEGPVVHAAPFLMTDIPLLRNFLPSLQIMEDPYREARATWDTLRMQVLKTCVESHLIPSLKKEIKRDLVRLGKEALVDAIAVNFKRRLAVGPFMPPMEDEREVIKSLLLSCPDRPNAYTVAAIYQMPDRESDISMIYLDKDGVVIARDLIPHKTKGQSKERIKHFLFEWKPEVITLNSSAGEVAKKLSMDLERNIIKDISEMLQLQARLKAEENEDEEEEQEKEPFKPYAPYVVVADDTLANIFKKSSRAKKMFPDMIPDTAAAVSLARTVQEPLSQYCLLWKGVDSANNFGYEAMYLNLHPQQELVVKQANKVLRALENKLVDAVCDIGVDLNKACSLDHIAPMLPFVAGLGLRKAEMLRQQITAKKSRMDSRLSLLDLKLLGPVVWKNAAGFLRITSAAEDRQLDPFDNTRIHPELYRVYDFAQKICTDALETEDSDIVNYAPTVLQLMATVRKDLEKRIRRYPIWLDAWREGKPKPGKIAYSGPNQSPHSFDIELNDCLAQLLLEEYALDIEKQGKGKRRLEFELIKDELRYPWLDLRTPLRSLSDAEIFDVVCSNAGQQLMVGQKIGCTVIDVEDASYMDRATDYVRRKQKALVRTDNGLRGVITPYELVDERVDVNTLNMKDFLQPGAHIIALLIGVQKDRFSLDLSMKPSYLERSEAWWIENRNTDSYAKKWWETMQPTLRPENFYDRFFREGEALQQYYSLETSMLSSVKNATGALEKITLQQQQQQQRGGRGLSRVIHHPLYANVDFKTAEQRLRAEGKGAGAVLFRPSSKGSNFLTLTWAFRDNQFKHISIEEKGKRAGELGLGNELYVQEDDMKEPYSDLDELFARYVEPMNGYVATMVRHDFFRPGTPEEVEAEMFAQLREKPGRIPYFIRFEPSRPGSFVLTWVSLNRNQSPSVKTMRIDVRPKGYVMQGETFASPSRLIVWFKQLNEKALEKQRQQQAAAPAVPRRANSRFQPQQQSGIPPPPLPPSSYYQR